MSGAVQVRASLMVICVKRFSKHWESQKAGGSSEFLGKRFDSIRTGDFEILLELASFFISCAAVVHVREPAHMLTNSHEWCVGCA